MIEGSRKAMTLPPPDPRDAEHALPCMCGFISDFLDKNRPPRGQDHWALCPAEYRPVVNALLAPRDATIKALREALTIIMAKAGSHTVAVPNRGKNDPGFAGIYEVARAALTREPGDGE